MYNYPIWSQFSPKQREKEEEFKYFEIIFATLNVKDTSENTLSMYATYTIYIPGRGKGVRIYHMYFINWPTWMLRII